MVPILHETAAFVVCCKPVGVSAQGADDAALPQLLKNQLKCEIFPVHRLDQAVGGVMVCAKTAKEAARLSACIAAGTFRKTYLAVVTGCPAETCGEWEDLLFHDRAKNKTFIVKRMRGGVKKARLAYEVLAARDGKSLVRVRLYTGRTHQIRVQFASRGFPLVGDGKYGSRENGCACALWSHALEFPAADGHTLSFSAPMPDTFPWNAFTAAYCGSGGAYGSNAAQNTPEK